MGARALRLPVATFFGALLLNGAPAAAQEAPAGSVAQSAVGQAGQRQTRDQNTLHVDPLDRIDSRIANRVQSRLRNRIDRFYDPRANATSPFTVASEQAGTTGPAKRR